MPVRLFIPRLCISKVCQSFFSKVTWGQWTLSADMFCSHNISYRCWSSTSARPMTLCPLPFSQVAGEVLAKADYTPVLSIIDSLKSFFVGQVHLQIKKRSRFNSFYVLSFIFKCGLTICYTMFPQPVWTSPSAAQGQTKSIKVSAHYVCYSLLNSYGSVTERNNLSSSMISQKWEVLVFVPLRNSFA